jgi:transposase
LGRVFTDHAAKGGGNRNASKRQKTEEGHPKRLNPLRDNQVWRAYKVRMFPTLEQEKGLQKWFWAARWGYNQMVAAISHRKQPASTQTRDQLVKETPDEVAGICSKVYKRAMMEAVTAYTTNMAKRNKNPNHRFQLRFRSFRRSPTETVILEKATFLNDEKKQQQKKRPGRSRRPVDRNPHLRDGEHLHDCGPVKRILPYPVPMVGMHSRVNAILELGSTMAPLGGIRIKDRARIIDPLVSDHWLREDGKILFDKRRRSYHLVVLVRRDIPVDPDPEGNHKTVVSLDPGCRRFQEFYDPSNGRHGELLAQYGDDGGSTVLGEIEKRCKKIDTLARRYRTQPWRDRPPSPEVVAQRLRRQGKPESEATDLGCYRDYVRQRQHQSRRWCQRHKQCEYRKLVHWRGNAHYSAANYLRREWDIVVYSTASFKDMCARNNRVIRSRTARQAYNWCHYQFNQRLLSKVPLYAGRVAVGVEEDGTSRTCGLCGAWNEHLGGSETFHCPEAACGVAIDRDVNGARNNLLCAYTRTMGFHRGQCINQRL